MANVLVLCESSGAVREAFRELGHNAWSCDLLPADDGSAYHLQMDAREAVDHFGPKYWDLVIGHPPCTYLSVSGLHWNTRVPGRSEKTEEALEFVRWMMNLDVPKIVIENPVSCISSRIRKPDQIIQPYQFGHDASKKTCLWLKGVEPLQIDPALYVAPRLVCGCSYVFSDDLGAYGCPNCGGDKAPAKPRWANQTDSGQNRLGPSEDRWKLRSATYAGIARAMAEQWGGDAR